MEREERRRKWVTRARDTLNLTHCRLVLKEISSLDWRPAIFYGEEEKKKKKKIKKKLRAAAAVSNECPK